VHVTLSRRTQSSRRRHHHQKSHSANTMVGKIREGPRLGSWQDDEHHPRREKAAMVYKLLRGYSNISAKKVKINLLLPRNTVN
jgi:hypothetical protein